MEELIKRGLERGWLLEPEAKDLCRNYGLSVGEWIVVRDLDDLKSAVEELGFPLVMKIVSPDVLHKSDVGGVILNIDSEEKAISSFEKIKEIAKKGGYRLDGVLVERMAPQGVETIIGAKMDPQFGPVLMFGLGGIFVEVFKDVSFRVAPIIKEEAMEMITELKAYPILKGIRGRKPSDINSLAEALVKISNIMIELPQISEIDLNPTIAYDVGYKIVDARILLKKGQ
ncbi:MAG: acetate--CoA ligase family protein [Candidatus Methanomethyliaceae archaeon]|nr:acetate--CoA ligase family protein [Candidatus Methanomethyliaceae archaeon]